MSRRWATRSSTAIALGTLSAPDELGHGDSVAFEPSSEAVEFEALTDAEFVLGSAAPHKHDLVLGYYSVHMPPAALRHGEAHIAAIRMRLVQEGRLSDIARLSRPCTHSRLVGAA